MRNTFQRVTDSLRLMPKKFFSDSSGNIAVMFSILLVPILFGMSAALDYSRATTVRSKIQAAADIAVIGAVSEKSEGVMLALHDNLIGTIPAAEEYADRLFEAQLTSATKKMVTKNKTKIIRKDGVFDGTLEFSAKVPTTLMHVMGWKNIEVSGVAKSKFSNSIYMDFFMLLDNTPSMGVGATPQDIATLERYTPDSCAFACHDKSNSNNYYNLAKDLNVQMRIDVVRQATQNLTKTATEVRRYNDQYRMAIYTFGEKAEAAGLTEVSGLSSNMKKVNKKANAIDLMTVPHHNFDNDQQTSFDTALTKIAPELANPGNGNSAATPQKVLFFVSDGVGDSYKPKTCTKKTTSWGRCQEPIDASLCKSLKESGVKIAVLYTTYLPLPKNNWYNSWIKPFQNDISTKMKECATEGLFFEVSPSGGISEAMNALFQKIISSPRLTG